MIGTFKCTIIDVEFGQRPNDDIYTATIPEFVLVDVKDGDASLSLIDTLTEKLIESLEELIEFDTPDEPYFEVTDVIFEYEEVVGA